MSSTARMPPPTVSGRNTRAAVRRDHVEDGVAVLVARGDVEEGELVRAGGVIDDGLLDRIAGVAQLKEIHPLHHPAVLHVQARDHPKLQHRPTSLSP